MDAPVRGGSAPLVSTGYRHCGERTHIVTGYAHVDGKRTVYIPVTKRSDASTLAVMARVKQALPSMQAVVPEALRKISLEFDQSRYVVDAIRSLINEGLLGALRTGLMVLIFLRDWRSAVIVITTIPIALLSAVVMLWIFGQTINIMTLGGLALAAGVLVDEATVEIENIHTPDMSGGLARPKAVIEAASRTATASLLYDVMHPVGLRFLAVHDRHHTSAVCTAIARGGFRTLASYAESEFAVWCRFCPCG